MTTASKGEGDVVDLAAKPWLSLDGPSLAQAAAALQLLPENVPFLLRLQRLAAIGASLPGRPGAVGLSPSRLRALLKEPEVSGARVQQAEDEYDDVYVAEVATPSGPRLLAQGLTSRSVHCLRLLLDALAGAADCAPVFNEVRPLVAATLDLSDVMCRRAGLRRGVHAPAAPPSNPAVPGRARLQALCDAVTFQASTGLRAVIEPLLVLPGAHELDFSEGTSDQLIVRPLLDDGERLIVCNPGELAAAVRHQTLVAASRLGLIPAVVRAFRREVANSAYEKLGILGYRPTDRAGEEVEDGLLEVRNFRGPADTLLSVAVMVDTLDDFDETDPFGYWSRADLGERVQHVLDPAGPERDEDSVTLRLAILDGFARANFFGLEARRRPGPLLTVRLDELDIMVHLDGADPLFLWRFAEANELLHSRTQVLSYSTLDTYAIYRDHDESFYLSDDEPPNFLSVTPSSGASLRIRDAVTHDRHIVRAPDSEYVELVCLYGLEEAPIYFVHPRHGNGDMVVEAESGAVWVHAPRSADPVLDGFASTVTEATAYWAWQLLSAGGSDGMTRRWLVDISFDDEAAWSRLLSGGKLPDAQPHVEWVRVSTSARGLTLTLCAACAGVLLLDDNTADRQLVTALGGGLFRDSVGLASAVQRVAPAGPKKMLLLATSDQAALRPARARPRYVRPGVVATVLDDLGAWLTAGGLAVGAIPSDLRTDVLARVVSYYFDSMANLVRQLSPVGLLEFLIAHDEALVHQTAVRRWRLGPRLACFGPESVVAKDEAEDRSRRAEASVASRFLIEYVGATPPTGSVPINLRIYDRILATAAELVSRATISDAIHFGFSDVQLSLLPSQRLGVSRGDRYSSGTIGLARAEAAASIALASGTRSDHHDVPRPALDPAKERARFESVSSALGEELGLTLVELANGMDVLLSAGLSDADDVVVVAESSVFEAFTRELGWEEAKGKALLSVSTIEPRPDFLSPGADCYPWRFNRDRSYLRRPLIVRGGPGAREVLFGTRRLAEARSYWIDLLRSGRFKAASTPLKKLMGAMRQDENRAFEQFVAFQLRAGGFEHVQASVRRFGGKRLLARDGADLGDIDAIGASVRTRTIVVVEAKDFETARTPAELANEADDLVRGGKSAVVRLLARADWVREHAGAVLAHLGVGGVASGWRVVPVVVVSRSLLSPRILDAEVPIVHADDLISWCRRYTGAGSGRGRRRGAR
jgi:hypothetical protein